MAEILGLGGIFVKCPKNGPNPEAYNTWWKTHMGIVPSEWGSMEWKNDGQAVTMLNAFKADTDYFVPSKAPFMINLRVDDVAGMLDKARAGGAKNVGDVQDEGYGIFGWFIDPIGIKIELWQDKS